MRRAGLLIVGVVMAATLVFASVAIAERLTGTSGPDFISGSSGDDKIAGGAGDDALRGRGGDDRMSGDSGDDGMNGNKGKDRLFGNSGNDLMRGGRGDDYINAIDHGEVDGVRCGRGDADKAFIDRRDRVRGGGCEQVFRRS